MAKEYFSHDYNARHDRKIAALVKDYKSTGYGIFWATCEMMHEEGDRLEFDDLTFHAISKDLNESEDLVKEVLEKCISTYKLFTKDDLLLTSNRVKKNLIGSSERKAAKSESGRLGGIKSGESRRSKQNEAPLEANEAELEATKQRRVKKSKVKESKEKKVNVNNTPTNFLEKSNLYRQPNIPIFEEVHRVFLQNGGNEKMAKTFFDKNESTAWFYKGSPITNFSNLVPSYIEQWKFNEKNKNGQRTTTEIGKNAEFDKP